MKTSFAIARPGLDENVEVELYSSASFHLTLVKPGRFLMGSNAESASPREQPVHEVRITKAYYIGTYPVTQAQWGAVFPGHQPSRFIGPNLPVEQVSWHDIVNGNQKGGLPEAFLTCINRELAKAPEWADYAFRLPTEAEWEYAAKGGHLGPQDLGQDAATEDAYPEYAGSDELMQVGWFGENSNSSTHPVGRKQPNALGLYDLSGNVWEWCVDYYDGRVYEKRAGQAPVESPVVEEGGSFRVLRGGSWFFSARGCRLSYRSLTRPGTRGYYYGFRLVLAPVRASE